MIKKWNIKMYKILHSYIQKNLHFYIDINTFFKDNNALAKYAGLTWRKTQSGNFEAETTRMTKTGNKYLRYYLIEAVSSLKNYSNDFKDFYTRKYNEVSHGAHKRALALSARKLVRLIFGLLHHNQLYSTTNVDNRKN